jgi:glycosyltransferase A (GT-A) superfamily protein (DUF2064 family)
VIDTVIVLAKAPVPGRVKTRLVPPLTHTQAAAVAGAALADTLRALAELPVRRRLLALDGAPGPWLPDGWDVVGQPAGGLDVRLAAAFLAADGPSVLVGMDTPQLQPHQLAAFDPATADAAIGLCDDGGYWAIGLRDPRRAAALIPGVPMSTPHTGAIQLRRLLDANLHVRLLDRLTDVDTIETARTVAELVPDSRFAHVLAAAQADLAAGVAARVGG